MAISDDFNFQRYLAAKKSVDDRSLNRVVWDRLQRELPEQREDDPLCILEIGAGIGTMFERLADWGLLEYVEYSAIDLDAENNRSAQKYLANWGGSRDWKILRDHGVLVFERNAQRLAYRPQKIGLDRFIEQTLPTEKRWDLLIAHAFLDLIDIPYTLSDMLSLLADGGLYYFTLNFDGMTILEPLVNPALDEQIISLYHRSMDERSKNGHRYGDSLTGRHLFQYLEGAGSEILVAGASDWVVYPLSGRYLADERYFLEHIIYTIHQELNDHPELDRDEFSCWIQERYDQIGRGELVYIAHQLDFLGRVKKEK